MPKNKVNENKESWFQQLSKDAPSKDFVDKNVKIEVMQEFEKKSYRQAKFKASCEGLTAEDAMDRASLFRSEDIAKFRIVKMVG